MATNESVGEEVEVESGAPALTDIPFEPEDTRPYNVVPDEPDLTGGKSAADLLAELKSRDEEMAKLRAQADQTAALQAAFGSVGDRLEKAVARPQVPSQLQAPVQAPGESDDAFAERMRIKLLENPVQAMLETFGRYYSPVLQRQAQANTMTSKQLLMLDPEKRDLYNRYREEIDAAAQSPALMGSPTAYQEAADRVAANHVNDLVEMRVQKAVEEALAKAGLGGTGGKVPPRPFVEGAPAKAPAATGGKLRITASKYEEYKRAAASMQMDVDQYIDLYVRSYD